jgi:hypothetical protein
MRVVSRIGGCAHVFHDGPGPALAISPRPVKVMARFLPMLGNDDRPCRLSATNCGGIVRLPPSPDSARRRNVDVGAGPRFDVSPGFESRGLGRKGTLVTQSGPQGRYKLADENLGFTEMLTTHRL